jgi:YARHG domain
MSKLLVAVTMLVALVSTSNAGDSWNQCSDLWTERNSYFANAGYCFKTPLAIRMFGNAGCVYDEENDVPLSQNIRARVNEIRRIERVMCR